MNKAIFSWHKENRKIWKNITQEDSYGHAVNEYEDAMEILKEVMNSEAYKRLKNTAVQ